SGDTTSGCAASARARFAGPGAASARARPSSSSHASASARSAFRDAMPALSLATGPRGGRPRPVPSRTVRVRAGGDRPRHPRNGSPGPATNRRWCRRRGRGTPAWSWRATLPGGEFAGQGARGGVAVKRRAFRSIDAGTLLEVVARGLGSSMEEARTLVTRGAVYVLGRRQRDAARSVAPGTEVLVVLEEAGRSSTAPLPTVHPLRVLHEDAQILAVDKPAGLPAQPTPGGATSLLLLASTHLGREAGLVHRLDRDTTGVMVFGKSPAATSALARSFRTGAARKQYLAVTMPALPEAGDCTLRLARDRRRPGRWVARPRDGLEAETLFRRLGAASDL